MRIASTLSVQVNPAGPNEDGFSGLLALEYCVPNPDDDHGQTRKKGEVMQDAEMFELSRTKEIWLMGLETVGAV
ncbi:MAG: hypothetical protein EBU01_16750 [Crocinitomicaceae bacterium]|nr:hypothetical protein [Crocinitomicaceae bacterium]